MKSPWKRMQPMEPGKQYLALASDIPPQRMSSTLRLFRGASAVKKQLRTAEGLVGFSMEASPLRKRYRTLSVWVDDAALAKFAGHGAHAEQMQELAPEMAPTTFVRWWVDGADGRPTWREGVRRLAQELDGSEPASPDRPS